MQPERAPLDPAAVLHRKLQTTRWLGFRLDVLVALLMTGDNGLSHESCMPSIAGEPVPPPFLLPPSPSARAIADP